MHQLIVERVVEVALEAAPAPARVVEPLCCTPAASPHLSWHPPIQPLIRTVVAAAD